MKFQGLTTTTTTRYVELTQDDIALALQQYLENKIDKPAAGASRVWRVEINSYSGRGDVTVTDTILKDVL